MYLCNYFWPVRPILIRFQTNISSIIGNAFHSKNGTDYKPSEAEII